MSSRKIVIVGYGNLGQGVHAAIEKNRDMELSGIISRDPDRVRQTLAARQLTVKTVLDANQKIDFSEQLPAEVAILCGGSKSDLTEQGPKFARHYNVVDSFDTHDRIPDYFQQMDKVGKRQKKLALISAGWDPGIFSVERVQAAAFFPESEIYSFWGPGVSQGHSDAVRQIPGVQDARQYTIPLEAALTAIRQGKNPDFEPGEKHFRKVYVVADEKANREEISRQIKTMPDYFEPYQTEVIFITQKELEEEHHEMSHGGTVLCTGKTGAAKINTEYSCNWGSNPGATGSILVAYARAVHRLARRGETGARTVLDICAADISPLSRRELRESFV